MSLSRREFLQALALASAAGLLPHRVNSRSIETPINYAIPKFGNTRLLHFTDCHAQLLPIYFREPHINLGIGPALGKAPHLVGDALLSEFNLDKQSIWAHAFTHLDYENMAHKFGRVGGFAHLATLVKNLRAIAGEENCLLLDGGDTWQGSGTAYKTHGMDMIQACNLLGVDVMTGHWEFTYQDQQVLKNIHAFNGDFVAQNIKASEEALFDGVVVYDDDSGHVFPPYVIKKVGTHNIAVIGQAFPYTPVANPKRFIPNWTFGINESDLQDLVNTIRQTQQPDAVVLLSHNGIDVDLKMAAQVNGLDVIFGGHTHDGVPKAVEVKNSNGITLVTNAGSNGKFLGVMDLVIKDGRVREYQYKLLPIFSNYIETDSAMQTHIDAVRKPHLPWLQEKLGATEDTLYRRGNFNGTFDQLICDALRTENDAEIALSPGFRWGTTLPTQSTITMEHVLDQTCMTYPETYRREISGENLKLILEDVCDNLFNPNPYYQQGGDMVRIGGMDYTCNPTAKIGDRINHMTLDDGTAIDPNKNYVVAGWATVNEKSAGPPVWEQVARYIKDQDRITINKLNTPKLINVENNPGLDAKFK